MADAKPPRLQALERLITSHPVEAMNRHLFIGRMLDEMRVPPELHDAEAGPLDDLYDLLMGASADGSESVLDPEGGTHANPLGA